jgi:long-subunit fatty acid transport protein
MNCVSRNFGAGILFALLTASSAQAGGLYLYELGTPDVGAAAAGWAARAQDASTVFTNPAGMTRLEKSELLVGVQPLYLRAEFSPDSNTNTSGSDGDASTWLPAGGLYYVHNLRPKLKIGVSTVGYFGLVFAKIKIEFTMPQALMFSAYHELSDRWAIMGNLGWQDWSEFGKVGVAVASAGTSSLTVDRNYKDTWHLAFGAQYRVADPWLLTAGVAYDSSMVDDKDRTPDLPLGEAWRFGYL